MEIFLFMFERLVHVLSLEILFHSLGTMGHSSSIARGLFPIEEGVDVRRVGGARRFCWRSISNVSGHDGVLFIIRLRSVRLRSGTIFERQRHGGAKQLTELLSG